MKIFGLSFLIKNFHDLIILNYCCCSYCLQYFSLNNQKCLNGASSQFSDQYLKGSQGLVTTTSDSSVNLTDYGSSEILKEQFNCKTYTLKVGIESLPKVSKEGVGGGEDNQLLFSLSFSFFLSLAYFFLLLSFPLIALYIP